MGKSKRANTKELLTKEYYMDYWTLRLTNIACNLFEWKNLPKEINPSAMEKSIMLGGYAIFFKDKLLDKYFALGGALTGVDVYGYPTRTRPISLSADITFPELDMNECVIIYANRTRSSAQLLINEYADKLSELDLAIKLNTMAMKHPLILRGTEETKQSMEALMRQYEQTYYHILVQKNVAIDKDIEVLNFKVDAIEILNLQKEKETVLNEFFGCFGIVASVEKRERMIAGELNAMMQQGGINRQVWLSTRQKACKQINEMYGLNLSVDYFNYNFEELAEEPEQKKEEKSNDE